MIDLDRFSENFKTIARAAEDMFLSLKEPEINKTTTDNSSESEKSQTTTEFSGEKKTNIYKESLAKIDIEQVLSYIDDFIGDYVHKHQDFFKQVPVKVKTWPHFKGSLPKYESDGASGLDVRAQINEPLQIQPGERSLVPTGLSMEVPKEYEIQARPRSGLALKKGLSLVNTPGTIDADYRGEIKIIMINLGTEAVSIADQERIAQVVICPVTKAKFEVVEDLSETHRGEGGFGSTGAN